MPRPKRNDDEAPEQSKPAHDRDEATCFHEAGHAIIRWAFARKFDRVEVLTRTERVENGRASGGIFGSDETFKLYPMFNADSQGDVSPFGHTKHEAEISMMCSLAGAVAEAMHLGVSDFRKSAQCMEGSCTDRRNAEKVAMMWRDPKERERVLKLAQWRVEALLRSTPGKEALRRIAAALMEKGKLTEINVNGIAAYVFRFLPPRRDHYAKNGIPKLELLRAGVLPVRMPTASARPRDDNFYADEEAYCRSPGFADVEEDNNEERQSHATLT